MAAAIVTLLLVWIPMVVKSSANLYEFILLLFTVAAAIQAMFFLRKIGHSVSIFIISLL